MSSNKGLRRLLIPRMCDGSTLVSAAFRGYGRRSLTLPFSTPESFSLGLSTCNGSECSPCFGALGDVLHFLRAPDFSPEEDAFFMPTSPGPCKFGQYSRLLRMLLDRAGYAKVPLVSPDSDKAYGDVGGQALYLHLWRAIVYSDLLMAARLRVRPYAHDPALAQTVYREQMARAEAALEAREDLTAAAREAAAAFGAVPTSPQPRPRIAILGEVYVRVNPFLNNRLAEILEEYGAEVDLEGVGEWIMASHVRALWQAWESRRVGEAARAWVRRAIMRRVEHRLRAPLRALLNDPPASVEKILDYNAPYLGNALLGEAALTVGGIIDRARRGFDGAINALPLNCMPGNSVKSQAARLTEDLGGFPILSLEFKDGNQGTHLRTRVAPFVESAAAFRQKRLAGKAAAIR